MQLLSSTQTPSCITTPCRMSAAEYSIYSQLPSTSEGRLRHWQHKVSYAIGTGTHLKRTRHVVMKNNQLQLDVKSNGARGGLKKGGGGAPRNGEKRPTLQERFTKCDKVPASKKTHHAVATRYRGSVIPW